MLVSTLAEKTVRNRIVVSLIGVFAMAAGEAANAAPQITSLSSSSSPRSGRLLILGTEFGSAQNGGVVLIGGTNAIATTWSNTEIHAYVPEAASIGPLPVQVSTSGGSSNVVMLDVTMRQPNGRIQWSFQTDDYVPLQFVARGPDGTVYVSDWVGLYALSPDGGLVWFVAGAGGGRPISFGADGTIYTGGAPGTLVWALNPDGSVRWTIPNTVGQPLLAGPNVGPDGNIYAVQDTTSGEGFGHFSLDANGDVRFSQVFFWSFAGGNSEITFGDGRFYASWQVNASAAAGVHVFDMNNGDFLWGSGDVGVSANGYPVLDSIGRLLLAYTGSGTVAVTPDGNPDWIAHYPPGTNVLLQPTVGASGVAYSGNWLSVELWAFDSNGDTVWLAPPDNQSMLQRLSVAPDESIIVADGSLGFGQPAWARGYDTADGSLVWHLELPPENGVNQFSSSWSAKFTPDSRTAYFATGFVGDVNNYGYLYAVDVPFDPALDGDADGYPNTNDNCPLVPNEDQIDSDHDGIGNVCDTISDACVDAFIVCPGSVSGATAGATPDGASSCGNFPEIEKDVWFKYIPATGGTVFMDTCQSFWSNTMSVHTGCPGTVANELVCNDYACQGLSALSLDVTAGQTYYIRLTGFAANEIEYVLTITGPECGPPGPECAVDANCDDGNPCTDDLCEIDQTCTHAANSASCDDGDSCTTADSCAGGVCVGGPPNCTGAGCLDCDGDGTPDQCELPGNDCNGNSLPDDCDIAGGTSIDCNFNGTPDECEVNPVCFNDHCDQPAVLCPGTINGTTTGADSDGYANCGISGNSPDVWYGYTPLADGIATFSTCGSPYDTVLSAHSGCPGSMANEIACNDDDCGSFDSSITIDVIAAETYMIRVSGYNGDAGDFTLTLAGPDCTPGAPECAVDADCDDGNPCTDDACGIDGICAHVNNNAACEDGDSCTTADVCVAGVCVGGTMACSGVGCNDCNGNGRPDACDIADGTSADLNGDGVPDECDTPAPLQAPAPHDRKKNRYLSLGPDPSDISVALRITLTTSLHHPDAVGTNMWVGVPDANGIAMISPTPVTRRWPESIIHVTGCFISPVATYEIRATADGGVTFTDALSIGTIDRPGGGKFWGDTVGSFNGTEWTPPQGITNIDDAVAVIKTWQVAFGAAHITVTDVEPQFINGVVNFNDVLLVMLAFRGDPYPFGCPDDPCHDKTISPCP